MLIKNSISHSHNNEITYINRSNNKKLRSAVILFARVEKLIDIETWIDHYLNWCKFTNVIIVDNDSFIGPLKNIIKNKRVIIEPISGYWHHCDILIRMYTKYRTSFDYLACFDLDEYLWFNKEIYSDINDILMYMRKNNYNHFSIPWRYISYKYECIPSTRENSLLDECFYAYNHLDNQAYVQNGDTETTFREVPSKPILNTKLNCHASTTHLFFAYDPVTYDSEIGPIYDMSTAKMTGDYNNLNIILYHYYHPSIYDMKIKSTNRDPCSYSNVNNYDRLREQLAPKYTLYCNPFNHTPKINITKSTGFKDYKNNTTFLRYFPKDYKVIVPVHSNTEYVKKFMEYFDKEHLLFVFDRISIPLDFNYDYDYLVNFEGDDKFLAGKMRDFGAEQFDCDLIFFDQDRVPEYNPLLVINKLKQDYDILEFFIPRDPREWFLNDELCIPYDQPYPEQALRVGLYSGFSHTYTCGIYIKKEVIRTVKQLNSGRIFHPIFDGEWGSEDEFFGNETTALGFKIGYTLHPRLVNNNGGNYFNNPLDPNSPVHKAFFRSLYRKYYLLSVISKKFQPNSNEPVIPGKKLINDIEKTRKKLLKKYHHYLTKPDTIYNKRHINEINKYFERFFGLQKTDESEKEIKETKNSVSEKKKSKPKTKKDNKSKNPN